MILAGKNGKPGAKNREGQRGGSKITGGNRTGTQEGPGEQEAGAREAQSTHCGNQQWFTRISDVCISLRAAAEIRLASNSELSEEHRVI